jgi:hypothetical protein
LRSIRIEIYIDFYRQDFERIKDNDEWLALLRIDGFAKVDLLEIYLTRSSWDRRIARPPRSLVARWKRGDPMHITFIKPSNNLRDMIYDQPQLFETQTMLPSRGGYPFRMAASKPDSSLLLVSKQFSSEYKRRCEGRVELSVADDIDHLAMGTPYGVVGMPLTEDISSMHMHIGHWVLPSQLFPGLKDSLKRFKDWLSHWIAQMPKLETITVSLYPYENLIRMPEDRDMLVTKLCDLVSPNLLTEVKVSAVAGDGQWFLSVDPRKLLVDWQRQDAVCLQLIDPMVDYVETCCSDFFSGPSELSYDPSDGDEEDDE